MEKKEFFAIVLLILFVILCIASFQNKSVTTDEPLYLQAAGLMYFKGDFLHSLEHPPLIKMIIGLPFIFLDQDDNLLPWARFMIVLLGTLLGITIYLFAKKLYGINAALFALFLYSLSPNIIAHARLATLDIGTAFFFFVAAVCFYMFLEKQDLKWIIIAGITFGLAQSAKFTAVLLIPIYILMLIVFCLYKKKITKDKIKHLAAGLFGIMVIGLLVLHLLYLPQPEMPEEGQVMLEEMSGLVWKISKVFLPDNYVFGLGLQRDHSQYGHPAYLFGMHSETGWWYYYILALLVKVPIPMIVFFIFSIVFFKKLKHKNMFNEWFLIIPIVIIFLYFSFLNNVNTGIRNILPMCPFIFVFVSKLFDHKIKYWKHILAALCILYALSCFLIFPHYISYFNEAIGPQNGYKYLLDSNVDWGQNQQYVLDYEKDIGEEIITDPGCDPIQGLIVISVNSVQGLDKETADCYSWLREYEPEDMIAYTHLVYDTRI